MFAVAVASVLLYAAFTGITGVRVLALANKTRQLPEGLLGCSYLIGGMLGWALLLVGGALVVARPDKRPLAVLLQSAGLFCLNCGILTTSLFSWRVFTPRSVLAAALFFTQAAVLVADYVHNGVLTDAALPPATQPWFWPGMLARNFTYVWLSFITFRYYFMLRKRLPLGLADPVATNRVLLWGLIAFITLLYCVFASACSVLDLWDRHGEVLFLITGIMNSVGAVLGLLAFVPPARYLRWVEARAPKVTE